MRSQREVAGSSLFAGSSRVRYRAAPTDPPSDALGRIGSQAAGWRPSASSQARGFVAFHAWRRSAYDAAYVGVSRDASSRTRSPEPPRTARTGGQNQQEMLRKGAIASDLVERRTRGFGDRSARFLPIRRTELRGIGGPSSHEFTEGGRELWSYSCSRRTTTLSGNRTGQQLATGTLAACIDWQMAARLSRLGRWGNCGQKQAPGRGQTRRQ